MRFGQALGLVAIGLLALLVSLQVSRLAGRLDLPHFEAGRRRSATLDEATRARLASFDEEVRLTYFVTEREFLPAHLSHLEERVRDVLGAFERATREQARPFRIEVVYPDRHTDWEESIASAGVARWRARRVEGDGYRDDELWSSLRIGYGARPSAVFNGVDPQTVDRLQELILAQLEELRAPRRPRVAIDAPAGFDRLREVLHTGAEVLEVDFDQSATLPEGVDLFFWLDPERAREAHLAAIDSLQSRGGSAVIAAQSWQSRESWSGARLDVRFEEPVPSSATILQHFGLMPLDGLLLDPRGAEVVGPRATSGEAPSAIAPWLVRSTPDQQDFRGWSGQANGSLLFRTPLAFVPDGPRLEELGLSATVLASASDQSSLAEIPSTTISVDAAFELEGRPQPSAALCALLRPADPWSGQLLMLSDAGPLADEDAAFEYYAHGVFLQLVLSNLLSSERVVASRIALEGPAPLPELEPSERAWLRALVVLLVPSLFGLMYLLRARGRVSTGRNLPLLRLLLLPSAVAIPCVVLVSRWSPDLDLDATRDGRNRLTSAEREVFAQLLQEPVELQLLFSPASDLPPDYKSPVREVRRMCEKLEREFAAFQLNEIAVDRLDEDERQALETDGVLPLSLATSRDEVTRLYRIFAHLRLRRGEQQVVLGFPSARSFETLRFRLAHALHRLESGKPTTLALFTQPPRLSPAEATLEYQRKGLFAPRESDVFSELDDLLTENDFRVLRGNPGIDEIPTESDALLWMQPRRDTLPMTEDLANWLHGGGSALLAGQHFRIRSRQLEKTGLQQRFWPEPQFVDLERHYFPVLGIGVKRELIFSADHASMALETRVDDAEGGASYVMLPTTQAFLPRARSIQGQTEDSTSLPADPQSLGELRLPFANKLTFDQSELQRRGLEVTPWIRGIASHWSFDWRGGDLSEATLRGENEAQAPGDQPADPPALTHFEAAPTFGALIQGPFPAALLPEQDPRAGAPAPTLQVLEEPSDEVGRLLLLGNSEFLKNEGLNAVDFDHAGFALRAAAALSLPESFEVFLDREPSAPVLELQSDSTRLWWRSIVLGAFPMLLLAFGLLRRWRA